MIRCNFLQSLNKFYAGSGFVTFSLPSWFAALNKFEITNEKFGKAELGHFKLLFCRGRQRNVPRYIRHVHSYCTAHEDFLFRLKFPLLFS